jgi:hypothetical protein
MADGPDDGSIAPRRGLGGPILPPPPAELSKGNDTSSGPSGQAAEGPSQPARPTGGDRPRWQRPQRAPRPARSPSRQVSGQGSGQAAGQAPVARPAAKPTARRTRRAQLRLVQVDAWSVMKTSFLLSIALGIVLVVAVAIIWSVLGAAGVWESINSIVQQAVGGTTGDPFDIREYAGTSRVLGFTMIVAVLDVILITAIATLGAFLYNLSAALLGGIEVTLAEDN